MTLLRAAPFGATPRPSQVFTLSTASGPLYFTLLLSLTLFSKKNLPNLFQPDVKSSESWNFNTPIIQHLGGRINSGLSYFSLLPLQPEMFACSIPSISKLGIDGFARR
ncbi:hypothetical protein BOTBODRAFT_70050 [Botryobasidium botryosum FD-172 SS1]|uniref:Uncharacterized protein n=1 Tax=Botryobasidium botryosum (strain FD-172 SS1) TaxID=930990 RepID=A0A067M8T5_BOTB1|nr:hypothetical protein BOTBODRAFT_70050 [Botryobasidium botryosum FD-172 SS1]